MSFLDAPEFTTRDPGPRGLLDALVAAYRNKQVILPLLIEAGIEDTNVYLDAAARDAWLDVLRYAARSGKLRTLVETAAADNTIGGYQDKLRSFLTESAKAAATKDEALAFEIENALSNAGRCRSPIVIALEIDGEPLTEQGMPRTARHLTIRLSEGQVESAETSARETLTGATSISEIVEAGGRIWDEVLLAAEPRLSALVERIAGATVSQPVAWCGRPDLLGRLQPALLIAHAGGDDVTGFLWAGAGGHYLMPVESAQDTRTMRQRSPSPRPTVTVAVADLRIEGAGREQEKLREAAARDIVIGVGTDVSLPAAFGEALKSDSTLPARAILVFGPAPDAEATSQLLGLMPSFSVADGRIAEPALLSALEKALGRYAESIALPGIVAAARTAWIRWAIERRDVEACLRGLSWSTWSYIGLPLFAKQYGEVGPAAYPHLMDLRAVASGEWYFNRRDNIDSVYQADELARQPRDERFHLYLSGAGGTGKSCFLRYVHDQIVSRPHRVAVWYRIDAPSSSWENIEDRLREETVAAVGVKMGADAASRVAEIPGGLGIFLPEAVRLLGERELRFDGITVFIDQLERTFESGDEPDPPSLEAISRELVDLLKDVGVGRGVRVFVASRKQYLPDFLGSSQKAKECRLDFNVLQSIADDTERVGFVRRVLAWCHTQRLVEPTVTIDNEAARSLAVHAHGHPMNMMLALIQLLSENLSGQVTSDQLDGYRPWTRLFALDLQAAARDDLDWFFMLAMAHARTEIVSFEEVWWRLRMVDPRLTRQVEELGPTGILERLWLLGFLGRTIHARPHGGEPGRFVEFFHANLRDYLLQDVMARGGADLGSGGRRGGSPPTWRALDRLTAYARDWAQTQQLLPADDVRVLMQHRDQVIEKFHVYGEPEPSPPFFLLFLQDRRESREPLSTAAQECLAYSALVHDDGGRPTFDALFPDVKDQVQCCHAWLSRCAADSWPAVLRFLIPLETATARNELIQLVLDSTNPPREEIAQAVAGVLAEPLYAARWRSEVLTAVLGAALRRVNGQPDQLPRQVTSFLAASCDWDRDTLVTAVSYIIDRLGSSTDPELSALAGRLGKGADIDRWLAPGDGASFRTVSVRRRESNVIASSVQLALGGELRAAADAARMAAWSSELRDVLGVPLPDIQLFEGEAEGCEAELRLQGQLVSRNAFYPGRVCVPKRRWDAFGKPTPPESIQSSEPAEEDVLWMPLSELTATGYQSAALDFDEAVVRWLEYHCRRAFDLLFDGELLLALAREAQSSPGRRRRLQGVSNPQLRQVVVDLVEEGVPLPAGSRRDAMFEELSKLVQRVPQPELLSQKLREYLKTDICRSVVDDSGQVTTILLDDELEVMLASRVEVNNGRLVLGLDSSDAKELDSAVHRHVTRILEESGPTPVLVLTVPTLRQPLARLLHRFDSALGARLDPRLPVLSFTELATPDMALLPGGLVSVTLSAAARP